MANWIDKKDDRFNGCLMVLNIGQDNIHTLPGDYKENLQAAIADGHAGGLLTLYVFDSETGPFPIPDEFDNVEGMDHVRMMFDVGGRRDCDFSLLPDQRMEEFRKIGEVIRGHQGFNFSPTNLKICGWCKISGSKVLLPLTPIP